MRFFFGLLLAIVLAGCQQGNQGAALQDLQGRVDSFQTATQDLKRQVQALRDSIQVPEEDTTLRPPIYFPSGSAWIPDRGRQRLNEHAATLKDEHPDAGFRVQGYTDPVPIGASLKDTYPSNWYLSAQRAAAVAHYLDTNHDIRTESLEIEAFGPRTTVGPNETPERRREDRRVEIVVEGGS
ncbi:OmpA/MotB family protein [Salinibacter altiplanensis]|uniref:OmpA/MotB family protein n=1 Tax=Salinibacter altiplanensis TaxID=1803181 RepID=UPI000C9EF61E|nr:OmpA family protein [Salinibacter altiplanensis]